MRQNPAFHMVFTVPPSPRHVVAECCFINKHTIVIETCWDATASQQRPKPGVLHFEQWSNTIGSMYSISTYIGLIFYGFLWSM